MRNLRDHVGRVVVAIGPRKDQYAEFHNFRLSGPQMQLLRQLACFFSARFSTVSRASFCSLYSPAVIVPDSFSLSMAKISSLRTDSSVAWCDPWDMGRAAEAE